MAKKKIADEDREFVWWIEKANITIKFLTLAIEDTNLGDEYSIGLRNGMRLALACLTGEEPKFEKVGADVCELTAEQIEELSEGHHE